MAQFAVAHGVGPAREGRRALIEQRMYQLIRQHRPIRDHLFEIELLDPGAEAFALTFG